MMHPVDVLILQMVATRASAEALAHQVTAMINSLQQMKEDTPAATTDVPAPTVPASPPVSEPDEVEGCTHPSNERYPCARMGYPNAYMCRVCGEEVLQ